MVPQTSVPKIGNAYIRVLGRQLDRFIEFEFILNDSDLSVELVMPETAFHDFCREYDAEILPPEKQAATGLHETSKAPGLYRTAPAEFGDEPSS